jgi:hypothetical protein
MIHNDISINAILDLQIDNCSVTFVFDTNDFYTKKEKNMASYNNAQYTYQQVLNGTGYFKKDDSGNFSNGVRELQARLRTANYFNKTPNGIFESYTEKRVTLFQKDHEGLSIDGAAGKNTLKILNIVSSSIQMNGNDDGIFRYSRELTYSEMTTNSKYIFDFLKAKGWTLQAICGMLGNFNIESHMNPSRWQNGYKTPSNGYGIAQWTPSTKYTTWASNNGLKKGNMDSQLKRILYEVNHPSEQWGNKIDMSFSDYIHSTQSAYDLAKVWFYNYEQPSSTDTLTRRRRYARGWYKRLS